MKLRQWTELPEYMRTPEVQEYYHILSKRSVWLKVKRIIDICLSVIALIVLLLPMVIMAIIIKVDSKGPVFFTQKRVTQYGRTFNIIKFRTMIYSPQTQGTAVTVNEDPRVTKVGKVLRKYRLDELPQFINVCMGDMTIVGTRPEVPEYVDCYTHVMYATLLLPAGITSKASIEFKDESRLMEDKDNPQDIYINEILPQKMEYNLEAIKKTSFIEELRILLQTVKVL